MVTRFAPAPDASVGSVSVFQTSLAVPRPHWAFFTRGLSDRGFELTLRVPRGPDELAPPAWALSAFRELVATACADAATTGNPPLSPAQVLTPGHPIASGAASELASFAFVADPALAAMFPAETPVVPLMAVGLTRDEERLVREWSPRGLLEILARADPLLLTDLDRSSLLQSPRARAAIDQRVEREGSSMAAMWAARSELQVVAGKATWRLASAAVETLSSLLKGRIGHQRPFSVHAPGSTLVITPADVAGVSVDGQAATLALSQTAARALRAAVRGAPGRYPVDAVPGLTIEVV
jgi:hypothetical protein